MKRLNLMLAFAGCIAFSNVKAQMVNNVKLTDLKEEYIEISAFKSVFNSNTFIYLEYGQKALDRQNLIVKDDKGVNLAYNSAIAFVNEMKKYGYELFQAYSLTYSDGATPKYVLKKKSSQPLGT